MLKAQLHTHTKEDPIDSNFIKYSAKEIINYAAKKGFEVLSITCHNTIVHNKQLQNYANKRNILLIPGVEKTIQGKHVLIYNIDQEDIKNINSFVDLKKFKKETKKEILIVAPHPFFYLTTCLKNKIIRYLELFDAWEFSFFYTKYFNKNKKMLKLAKRYNKPLLGNSDVHHLIYFEKTYSLIDADKNIESVLQAIKNNKSKIITKPLKLSTFFKHVFTSVISRIKNKSL